jgi:hypothetical protein
MLNNYDWSGDYEVGMQCRESFTIAYTHAGEDAFWARARTLTGKTCGEYSYSSKYWAGDLPYTAHIGLSSSCHTINRTDTSYSRTSLWWEHSSSFFWGFTTQYSMAYFYNKTNIYTLSGATSCIDNVTLYIKYDGNYYISNYKDLSNISDSYSFEIINQTTYKIIFSDGYENEFICNDNKVINNECAGIALNFKDNCGNLITKSAGTYYSSGAPAALNFYTGTGHYNITFDDQEYLEIWVDSIIGTLYYNISNPQNNTIITYTILNPTISWNNNIYVVDGNMSLPIESALVTFSQDCIITPSLYPSRNKYTDNNGYVTFGECELDIFSLFISADGYKSFSNTSISSSNMNAFCLEQTIIVKLYPCSEENESEYNYTDYGTWIFFKDVNGNHTTEILDTDNYVDLYYYNNNTESESMTLKFQKYSIGTGTIDLLSWNIPYNTDGYKRILKSNYTDVSYLYIGHLYNHTLDGWDRTEYLNVRNGSAEIDLDYQNLSAFSWFRNKNIEGSIDYREDINIIGYANSTNVSLLVISLELYDNGLYVTHTNLTWSNFTTADLKYFYEWNPAHSYVNGHNYTVRMHGYDHYLLCTDYINASDYRKNKLTILVKNQYGTDLVNSYIFLEGYGSLSTSDQHYNSYEGLENGYYRYKATKPDHEGGGWSDVTLSNGDQVVTYVLVALDGASGSAVPIKMSDTTLRNLYIPLMAILLILILFGGLKSVL